MQVTGFGRTCKCGIACSLDSVLTRKRCMSWLALVYLR